MNDKSEVDKVEDKEKKSDMTLEEAKEYVEKILDAIAKDKDRLYLISTRGIGDFILTGGLSQAAQQRKNKKSTVILASYQKMDTGISFPNVSEVVGCTHNAIAAFDDYFHDTGKYEGDNYIYANFNRNKDKVLWTPNLNILERFKVDVLKVPVDTPFVYPFVDKLSEKEIAELHKKYIFDKERTIILFPHANTFKNSINKEIWPAMAQRLKEKNYIVYTNVAGKEEPLEGTQAFRVTFAELYNISEMVKCFIGINSGVFMFLAMTNAKLLSITVFPNWFWDISFVFPECNNHTFYSTDKYNKDIEKALKKYDASAKVKYSHDRIAPEDIFYSDDEILEAILQDVEKI